MGYVDAVKLTANPERPASQDESQTAKHDKVVAVYDYTCTHLKVRAAPVPTLTPTPSPPRAAGVWGRGVAKQRRRTVVKRGKSLARVRTELTKSRPRAQQHVRFDQSSTATAAEQRARHAVVP